MIKVNKMDEDMEMLEDLKRYSARKKRSFSNVINSKNLSDEDMDEMFLGY